MSQLLKKIRAKYPAAGFAELEAVLTGYRARFIRRVECGHLKNRDRLIGQNGTIFLLKTLQRSCSMVEGFIECAGRRDPLLAFMAVRAHFESSGSIAHFAKYLHKYHRSEIDYERMNKVLRALSLGGRTFPRRDEYSHAPDAINVLTQIKAVDQYLNQLAPDEQTSARFRDEYDFLCEFCHPNFLGLSMGSQITEQAVVVFTRRPRLTQGDAASLVDHISLSAMVFCDIFDECLKALRNKEEMPILYK